MFQPQTYFIALMLMFVTMLLGFLGQHRQSVSRLPLSALLLGLRDWTHTWGCGVGPDIGQLRHLRQANGCRPAPSDWTHVGYAIAGGVIFNVANLLLVAAIDIAGLAVAFPVGIGLALVVGAISS